MPSDSSAASVIAVELDRLARRGIDRSFKKLGAKGPIDIPRLGELAERRFPLEWRKYKEQALELLIRAGISRIEGSFGKVSYQHAALRLFNLESAPGDMAVVKSLYLDDRGWRYSYILEVLSAEAAIYGSDSLMKVKVRKLRQRLAVILADLDMSSTAVGLEVPSTRVVAVVGEVEDDYIKRDRYHLHFHQALASGHRAFLFSGLPGVGKTRLVSEIVAEAQRYVGGSVENYDCSDYEGFISAVSKLSIRGELAPVDQTDRQMLKAFIDRLYGPNSPNFTVLQRYSATVVMDLLDVTRVDKVIVIVSDSGPDVEGYLRIDVDPLSVSEAAALIQQALPSIKMAEAFELVDRLGVSPQVLEAASAILSHKGVSVTVDALCRAFLRNAPAILRDFDGDLGSRLEEVLDTLRMRQSGAVEILERMLLLGDLVPVDLLVACAAHADGFDAGQEDIVRVLVERNLQVLATLALIDQDEQVIKLYKSARLVSRVLVHTERGKYLTAELRAVILKRISSVMSEQEQRSITAVMESARDLIYHLFHVEIATTGNQDENRAGRAVAEALYGPSEDLGPGYIKSVKLVGRGDNFVMHRITVGLHASNSQSSSNELAQISEAIEELLSKTRHSVPRDRG